MSKKTCYLAGAMAAVTEDEASEWRRIARNYLSDSFKCIDPTEYYSYSCQLHTNDSEVMRFDLHKVKTSDIVLVNLNHIRESIGTCDEILYAYMHDIPVIGFIESEKDLDTDEIIKYVHPWKYLQINRIETGENAMIKALGYLEDYYA